MARQVENLRPRIESLCAELLDGLADKNEFDVIESYATPIPVIVIAELLGVPAEMAPSLSIERVRFCAQHAMQVR